MNVSVDTSQKPANTMSIEDIIKDTQYQHQDRKDSFANPAFLRSVDQKQTSKKKQNVFKASPDNEPIIEIESFGANNANISFTNIESRKTLENKQQGIQEDQNALSQTSIQEFKDNHHPTKTKQIFKKAYTLVYQKDIEIAFLLLAKKELQIEQTLKKIERIQQNEMKIPKLERQIQASRDRISELLEAQNQLQRRKEALTEDVVQIEQKDSVRATLLEPYREQFEDFKRKKSFFEKKNYKYKKELIIYCVCILVYVLVSYPVVRGFINISRK